MKRLLLIPHLLINNANALSSPFTVGFPALTAWLGAVHSIQRNLHELNVFREIKLAGVGIISHNFMMRSLKPQKFGDNVLVGMAFPLTKDGDRASFVEEAKCSLEVTLVVEVNGLDPAFSEQFCETINMLISKGKRFAGGDVLSLQPPIIIAGESEDILRILKKKLMPGYLLIERRELMQELMKEEGIDALDALLQNVAIYNDCSNPDNPVWETSKKHPGWIVPIGVGYQRISDFFNSGFERDLTVPHAFAESVVTLGEFVMPYRIKKLSDIFWRYSVDKDRGLYLCTNFEPLKKE